MQRTVKRYSPKLTSMFFAPHTAAPARPPPPVPGSLSISDSFGIMTLCTPFPPALNWGPQMASHEECPYWQGTTAGSLPTAGCSHRSQVEQASPPPMYIFRGANADQHVTGLPRPQQTVATALGPRHRNSLDESATEHSSRATRQDADGQTDHGDTNGTENMEDVPLPSCVPHAAGEQDQPVGSRTDSTITCGLPFRLLWNKLFGRWYK